MDLATEQPLPAPGDGPSVQSMVRDDLVTRERIGVERYGRALRPHNGRDMLRDLYEELLDGACYIRAAMAERAATDGGAPATVTYRAERVDGGDTDDWARESGVVGTERWAVWVSEPGRTWPLATDMYRWAAEQLADALTAAGTTFRHP